MSYSHPRFLLNYNIDYLSNHIASHILGESFGAFGFVLNSSGEYSQRRIKSLDDASAGTVRAGTSLPCVPERRH